MNPTSHRSRTTRGTLLAGLGALTLMALTACGSGVTEPTGGGSPSAGGTEVVLTNCGRQVTVTGTPEAIVGLSPAQTELLLRLGLADRMVGQAQTATAPLPEDLRAQAADIPVLSEDTPPSREVLLRAAPDFVVAPTAYEFTAEQGFASLEQLQEAGVAAYVATGGCADRRMTGTVEDLFTDLANLGEALDAEEAAADLTEEARATLDDVAERVAGRDPLTVAQVYLEGNTLSAIGAGIEYDIIRRAGGANVFGPDDSEFAEFFAAQITPETLAERNPEALVFTVHDAAHEQATRDYLTRTFPDVEAVRAGRLIALSGSDVYPGTLGNVTAVRQVAAGLYPDAF
ncbi:ABC transporter substrate-binding protein [Allostreptomyces psammosilenae]|uniref:Iron complex transport system substrate-binding protein n=1 Tax=Allostreptomyces psammosilenae TaxID=1892865 RepID=A0A852ZV86_9ACTN|nr:ABC transporter substrate-binding protein [Allostreptomyces psammosilenae]NYI04694.1 iron complex transport system substrate-binding protein [Allostreptomyces psammosilenae]